MLNSFQAPSVQMLGENLAETITSNPLVFMPETPLVQVVTTMCRAQFSTCQLTINGIPTQSQVAPESYALIMVDTQVLGICTECDLVQLAAREVSLKGLTIADVMTAPVITWRESQLTDVFATLQFMQSRRIRHLPILDLHDNLLGVVTPQSLQRHLKLTDVLRLWQIHEVMQTQVVHTPPHTSVLEIAHLMVNQRTSCVVIAEPLSDAIIRPVGIVTEQDIVQFQCRDLNLANLPAHSIISTPLQCLQPEDTLWEAHMLMQERRVSRLVITNSQRQLVGLVTQPHLLTIFRSGEMYETLHTLQHRIQELEAENLNLRHGHQLMLDQQMGQRIEELQEQADREQFLAVFARQVSQSLDFQAMLASAVQEVKRFLDCDRVVVYQFEDNLQGTVIAEAVESAWSATLGSHYQDVCFPKWLEAEYLDGRQRLVDDIYRADLQDCHIEFLESLQVKGYLIVPIVIGNQLWGLLAAHHCAKIRPWQRPNLDMIDRLSIQLAIAIQQGQLYHQAQIEIQERQQAELDLQLERNFANAIVNAAGALVVVSDSTGRIVQFNYTCQHLTGYTLEEVQGRRVWDFLIPLEDRARVRQLIEDVLANNSQGVSENYWLTKTGEHRLIAWTNSTLLDPQGRVEYVIGTGIDVTEARQAEAALRKSEATNRALLDTIPDLMIRMNRDGTYLDFLPARGVKVVQPFEQMVGRTIFESMPPHVARERMGYIEQALKTQQAQLYEYEFEADGKIFYEEARIAISGEDEVLVIIRDISERKHLEAARRQAEEALHNVVTGTAAATGEHFFEALVEHLAIALNVSHTMVTIYDGDHLHTIASYAYGQLQPNISFDIRNLPCKVTLQQQAYCCPQGLTQLFSDERLASFEAESYLGLALHNTQGRAVGTLCILDNKPIENESQVKGILKIFAARAAAELERQQSIQALQELNQELETRVDARTKELSDINVAVLESNIALLESQEQLRRSEELLRLTIDNAPIGIATIDLNGQFLTVNQAFCTMLGHSSAKIMEQAFHILTHPDDRAVSQRGMQQLITGTSATFELENRYLHKDGTAVDTVTRIATVHDLEGRPLYFVAEIEDIRDRKRAEAERTRLLSILEASLNEIYIFDAETLQFSYVNQGALSNLNYTLLQMQKMTPIDIKPTLTALEFEDLIAPLLCYETGKINFETIHQRADGSCYPVDVHLQLIERENERIFLAVVLDITDRKQAKEQIDRQLLAIETVIDGIAIFRQGIYQYVNQAHARLFGYDSATDLLGQNWEMFHSDPEKVRFQEEVFPALAAQGHWQGEAIATRRDGSNFYVEVSMTLSAKGDLICVCRDINERKQAEVALRESKELLQDFFDNASDLIQSVSMPDGHFLFVNQAWIETLGYGREELENLTIFEILTPESIQQYQHIFQAMQQGYCTTLDHVEMVLMTKTGDIVQLEGNINVRIEHEVPVATRGIFRNVTERHRAEKAMQQQLAAIEAANDGIAILDSQSRYRFVNPAHCRLFGLEPADLLGNTWHSLYSTKEITRFEQDVFPYLMEHHHWRGEALAMRKDGSTFPQEVSLTQIEGVGLVCVCQDISDRKAAEAEIQRALEAERELNDLKSRFVSMTSHEFRTPLGVIASSAGIIQDYGDRLNAAKHQKHLTRIQDSVKHMTQLLEDVLTLSRVEAGKMQLRLETTHILDFCQEIIEELNLSDGSNRIKMQVDAIPSTAVMVDQRLLRQILTNLLSNALKYSFLDSTVHLRLIASAQTFDIVIQDQGIGVPEEDLKHLFQSFYRARNVGNIPGTGLGLSIVKKLVELHHGKIICQSEVNVGTTFTLRFPIRFVS